MEVNLLLLGDLQSCPEVQQVPRPAEFRKITRVLDKRIPGFRQLPIYQERRLAGHISRAALGRPIHREHSGRRPVGSESARQGHLQSGIVPAAGYRVGAGWKTEEQNHGYIEFTWCGAKLFFYSEGKVAKSRTRASASVQVVEIVRHRETQLSPPGDTRSEEHTS